ncbi:MAG: hypothetical protein HYY10_00485 [Candidatus Liptonbacteria bacterium]|nr:hypothetical protein [Candidatus Liptonbacteria bacterium]
MEQGIRNCQNCRAQFTVAPEDFQFYEKIKVPPPTFCSPCRYQRRLMVRNERNLYHRECGLCKKAMVSMFSSEKPFPVHCQECWWGDGWDPVQYGTAYDWNKPFFLQLRELQSKVPRPNLGTVNCKNSEYVNYVGDAKDCYLIFGSIEVENCLYGSPYESKYCVDTYLARESEYCYECIDCEKLSNCSFCEDCTASLNLLYCFDCKNCQDCIGCVGLRNKNYRIFNRQFTKEAYLKEKERIMSGGRSALEEVRGRFEELQQRIPRRFSTILQCANVSGDHIVQSKNARECFDVKRAEECAYCVRMIDAKDAHDVNYCEYLELCYEYLGFWKMARSKFSNMCGESADVEYADLCSSSSDLFGCVGLRNRHYCVLNRQYSKEEYEALIPKIKSHMDAMPFAGKNGRVYKYGEYFPAELSLLAYNESVAQDFFPLTYKEVVAAGFVWKEPERRNYAVTMQSADVPARIEDVRDSILEQILECATASPDASGARAEGQGPDPEASGCTTAFRIIPAEFQFYRRMKLPLPRLCPNCRHYSRLAKRNPLKLWHRRCMCSGAKSQGKITYSDTSEHFHKNTACPNEFETSFAPERTEIVYCEACYQAEVA